MIDETVAEIERMQTHSSSVVAVKAAHALLELTERDVRSLEAYERDLERNAAALRRANPSHASLHKAMHDVVDAVVGQSDDVEEAKSLTEEAVQRVVEGIETGKERAAAAAARTISDGDVILTHDYSSTVIRALETVADEGANVTVYVTEARPRYIGRRTARELASVPNVDPHLLVDSAAGHVLRETDCDRVVVGMDCIVGDTLYNRVGTFPIAATAKQVGATVSVVGSAAKLIDGGFVFENEFRSPTEVMLEPVEGITVENPAYDATPMSLVDEVLSGESDGRVS
jgi:translation initiation factor eIF-2B subunit delta